jgi:hypothetical protein
MITLHDYEVAERDLARREGRRGFVIHAVIYAIVMTGLTVLNLVLIGQTEDSFVWFPFPLAGWGIGLTMHYLHAVRWADREILARQGQIEKAAEALLRRS